MTFTDDATNDEELTSDAYPSGADTVVADLGAVPDHWGLIPKGLGIGDSFRLIFLTSTKTATTSTDISTYNTYVQNLAAASSHADIQDYSALFKGVGPTGDVNARDNTNTRHNSADRGRPIYWLDGNKVADNYQDFYNGNWETRPTTQTSLEQMHTTPPRLPTSPPRGANTTERSFSSYQPPGLWAPARSKSDDPITT